MSASADPSGRWSGRVESGQTGVPGQRPVSVFTAPESPGSPALDGSRPERRGRRVGRGELAAVASSLSDRDRAVVASVATFGLLRTTHLQQLHFQAQSTDDGRARIARRTIRRLADHRLIEPIERRIGGFRAGSEGTVWRIGPVGDRLIRQDEDTPRARRREPSLRFLEHRMLVADVVCALHVASLNGELELLRAAPEPVSWRTYNGSHGARETLKPDLFAITAVTDYEDHWFIEVDRGTESVPTLVRQCERYEQFRRSGREQQQSGIFPRVLWLVPTEHRRARVRAAIANHRAVPTDLFRVHTFGELLNVVLGGAS